MTFSSGLTAQIMPRHAAAQPGEDFIGVGSGGLRRHRPACTVSPSNSTSSPARSVPAGMALTSTRDQVHRHPAHQRHRLPPKAARPWLDADARICHRHIPAPRWQAWRAFWRGTWLRNQRFPPCQFGATAASRPLRTAAGCMGFSPISGLGMAAIKPDRRGGPDRNDNPCPAARRRTTPGWRARAAASPARCGSAKAVPGSSWPSGSSAQARWLITSTRSSPASRLRQLPARSVSSGRTGPAGSCRYRYGWRLPGCVRRSAAADQAAISARLFSTGTRLWRSAAPAPRRAAPRPARRCAPWAAAGAAPPLPPAGRQKSVSQPAPARAGATIAAPRP